MVRWASAQITRGLNLNFVPHKYQPLSKAAAPVAALAQTRPSNQSPDFLVTTDALRQELTMWFTLSCI